MRFTTTQERENAIKAMSEYLDAQPDGEDLSWDRIEADTGAKMDDAGRGLVRLALRGRPYETVRGVGIRLSCADTAMTIAHARLVRIDGAVRSADRTQQELQARHLAQMSGPEQQRMLMLASFFGAIRTVAKSATTKVFRTRSGAA